jgi:hypothetical protein
MGKTLSFRKNGERLVATASVWLNSSAGRRLVIYKKARARRAARASGSMSNSELRAFAPI